MNLKDATWQHREPDLDGEWKPDPLCNVMHPGPVHSIHRLNYTTVFILIMLAGSLFCWLLGEGAFDRFITR
jgi:hypothetical protein